MTLYQPEEPVLSHPGEYVVDQYQHSQLVVAASWLDEAHEHELLLTIGYLYVEALFVEVKAGYLLHVGQFLGIDARNHLAHYELSEEQHFTDICRAAEEYGKRVRSTSGVASDA